MKRIHKLLVAVAGGVAQVLSAGVVPARWAPMVATVLAIGTAVGVWRVPNVAP